MKKVLQWFSIALVMGGGGAIFFLSRNTENRTTNCCCAFCDPKVLEYQKFYEDELVIALYTHKPIFPGHSLIIPKKHVERFEMLSEAEVTRIGQVIQKVNKAAEKVFGTSSYLLLQKNGKEVGQSVPHVHFHYIPRQAGDDLSVKFVIKMYAANFRSPIKPTEMQEVVEKMKTAISN
jgi:histidine triad (HIT) family protein